MRRDYVSKQQVLVDAHHQHWGVHVEIMGQSAMLHLLIELDSTRPVDILIRDALAKGVRVYPGTRLRILLGFGGLSVEQIEEGVRVLARTWL
jgi:GntR family transcriptional regulator/MocR family aminotransferase